VRVGGTRREHATNLDAFRRRGQARGTERA
jgi:hypothetical protein